MKVTQEQALEALERIEDVCQNLKRTLQNVETLRQYIKGHGWQPIESAPRDGKAILLWRANHIFCGYYGGANSGWRHNVRHRDKIYPEPTHWRPLPEPHGRNLHTKGAR